LLDDRRLAAFRLPFFVLHFSYLSNTLFRLEKQAARRGAINTPTSLTRAKKDCVPK
jgi:hypothetical protein